MELDDSSEGFDQTSLVNSHNFNTINTQGLKSSQDFDTIGTSQNKIPAQTKDILNPPNFENDEIITLNVGGIKVFDILAFIKVNLTNC